MQKFRNSKLRKRSDGAVELAALCATPIKPSGQKTVMISMLPLPCTGKFRLKYFPQMVMFQ